MPPVLLSGFDTLQMAFYGVVRPPVMALLATEKPEAGSDKGVPVEVEGFRFELQPYGNRKGRYVLRNDDLRVVVAEFATESFPTVYVEFRAAFLWRRGVIPAVSEVRDWVRRILVRPDREVVSRADLAVDVQGMDPDLGRSSCYVGRSSRWYPHMIDRECTGFQFGKGAIVARHYNKTLEAALSRKEWFEDLWKRSPDYKPGEPVARVEFQFRREAFTSFRPRVDTFDHLWDQRTRLWRYATCRWLTLRRPLPGERRSRWPVDPDWQDLQDFRFEGAPGEPAIRGRQRACTLEMAVPQMAGWFQTLAALLEGNTVDDVATFLRCEIPKYLQKRGTTFSEGIQRKQAAMSEAVLDRSAHTDPAPVEPPR